VVAGVGDVNGDGYDDFMVGAPGTFGNYAKLFFGGSPLDTVADLTFRPEGVMGFFGTRIAPAGDVNGDGFDDVLIGGSGHMLGVDIAGSVSLYLGGQNMDTRADFTAKGRTDYHGLGTVLAGGGDINNDGYADFIAGGPNPPIVGKNVASSSLPANIYMGLVDLYLGGPILDSIPALTFTGNLVEGDEVYDFGKAGICDVDVNGDGYDDVIIGAPTIPDNDSYSHIVCIFYGGIDMDTIPDEILACPDTLAYGDFGRFIFSPGNVNRDGQDDYLVSSSYNSYLYLGLDSALILPAGIIAAGGDINSDGFSDILIDNKGYYGNASMNLEWNFFITHEQMTTISSLAFAGDINGDGYDEVLAGKQASLFPGETLFPMGKVFIFSLLDIPILHIEKPPHRPQGFRLKQNHPNPFNPTTTIIYALPEDAQVTLVIYDILGREVRQLVNTQMDRGYHQAIWNGRTNKGWEVPTGIYIARLVTPKYAKNIKMVLLK